MKLNEIIATTRDEDWDLIELTNAMAFDVLSITDGIVKANGSLDLTAIANRYLRNGKLGVKFDSVDGHFTCEMPKLMSCEGFPPEVDGSIRILVNSGMSWDGFTKKIGGNLRILTTEGSTISLVGISQNLEQMNGEISCKWSRVVEGGLELMNVKGFVKLVPSVISEPLPRPFRIICDHIENGWSIFDCQSQLIEEGFDEFAKM